MTREDLTREIEQLRHEAADMQRQASSSAHLIPERLDQCCSQLDAILDRLHKCNETAPQWSEGRLYAILENSSDSVSIVDAMGRTQWAAPSSFRLLGYSMEETIGQSLYSLLHPLDLPKMLQLSVKILARPGVCHTSVVRCRHQDGTWRLIEARATNLLGNPAVGGVVLNCRDITERHEVEQALRESREQYRLMIETVPMLAWRTNAAGETTECNERWYQYTGQTAAEASGNGWMRAIHPDDLLRIQQKVRDDVSGGIIYQSEYRLRRASDGAYRWHLARGLPLKDERGNILYWFGCAVDIHDQKQAEAVLTQSRDDLERLVTERTALLRASEERFRQLAGSINDVFWLFDLKLTECLYISPAYETILGRSCSTIYRQPRSFLEAIHPEDRGLADTLISEKFMKGLEFTAEARVLHVDGSVRWVLVRAFPIRDAHGNPYRMAGLVQDITRRRKLEEALLDIAEREQQRIASDLHDGLCNQLAGLNYLIKGLEQSLTGAPKKTAQHIAEQLREALTQARGIAHGLHPITVTDSSLPDALHRLAEKQSALYKIKCVAKTPFVPPSLAPTKATHLYRIAQEAILNAIKHGKAERITIQLALKNDNLVLSIRDHGVGLPAVPTNHNGIGTQIMHHRAESIGAVLTVTNVKPTGVLVTCILPLATTSKGDFSHVVQ
jgi:PAS domain S-box-containing protein